MKILGNRVGSRRKSDRTFRSRQLLQSGLVLLAVLGGGLGRAVDAQAADREPASSGDEYSFKWLDPDKKIYVLQNRRFLKANHLSLSALGGPGLSNSYRTSLNVSGRAAWFFSEAFGVEGFYTQGFNSENNTFYALKRSAPNALPVVREVRGQAGALLVFAPWYAKINVFNQILYFDWYFNAGAGVLTSALDTRSSSSASPTYQTESRTALYVGTGHLFHVSDSWDVRWDFQGAFYRAPVYQTAGEETWFPNYQLGLGVGVRL